MADVLVIGGGAAGMAAAIAAAECGDRVQLIERMERVGKKLLATGNGRCNLMNEGELRYPGGETLACDVLQRFPAERQKRFWHAHGLRMRTEDGGRVYPASGQATTVLDVFRLALTASGVEVITGTDVQKLQYRCGKWHAQTAQGQYLADRVIVAGGGCAQPKLGSNGSCWPMLEALGHHVSKARPCLTQIETETQKIRGLSGIRVRCGISVLRKGQVMHRQTGEALFADYGISGVCVMQCARYVRPGDTLCLDLATGLGFDNAEAVAEELLSRRHQWPDQSAELLLSGLVVPRLALALMKDAGIRCQHAAIAEITPAQLAELARVLGSFTLAVKGVKGFEQAQVTAGGVDWREVEPATMASRIADGLHLAGQVLDVDGDCGGFNLMFAFASGLLAGLNGRRAPWESA